jgi:hypothetical protein
MLREPEVVGVAEGDQLARRGLDAPVAGGCHAGVLLTDDLDRACECADDIGCSVGGAVVDDDELEVAVALPEDAARGGGDRPGRVVGGHHDGDPWAHRASSLS